MSRQLPSRPNLENLRNQAKSLVEELRKTNPDAQLADALHAIARDYGFASWPRLKAHVEAIAGSNPSDSPFNGRWIADLTRSTPHPANPLQRAVIEFNVVGDDVTLRHGFIDQTGRGHHGVDTLRVDGEVRIMPTGYGVIASWVAPNVLETVATKDGDVVGRGRYEVSPDGRTLTITAPDQRIVMTRTRYDIPLSQEAPR